IEKVTLNSDVLFAFDKADLTDAGKAEIDRVVDRVKDAKVDNIVLVGHADRIGSGEYNQRLSERRAEAVRAYLQQKAAAQNLQASGKGESQPVTGDQCKGIKNRDKLIECLQPDRRVEVEVFGTRTAGTGGTPGTAGTGGTGAPR
ncbi:MAG: OmpA family protein, partial [Betaproteobacteria bacterium]